MNDLDLFKSAMGDMGDVTPLKSTNDKVSSIKQKQDERSVAERKKAAQANTITDPNFLTAEQVELVAPDDILSYKKDGVQEGVFRNLRLGKYDIHAVLNLHGKSVREARTALFQFIEDCQKSDLRALLIQHGKGVKSQPHQAVVKSYINKWLPQFEQVLAFHSAQGFHGGAGSVYVLLKKSEEARMHNREKHQKRGA